MNTRSIRKQSGVMLIEALMGLLIFSMGILALVGMQATAISQVTDAKYRSDAAFLADRIIGEIWVNKGTGVPALTAAWATEVGNTLPNATGSNVPTVVTAGTQVTVTVFWQAPGASAVSNHVAIAHLDFNP
jgi:type IV pilus assembly protein PilV